MDTTNTHRLTQRERIELQSKIQRLQWLLKECIGIEEYELCSQIKAVIQRKSALLEPLQNENPSESISHSSKGD
jgi:protein-arginine kinase activator protein McsA